MMALPVYSKDRLRALDKGKPGNPRSVQRYLDGKFKVSLPDDHAAMQALAESMSPAEITRRAYSLYAQFRPERPEGKRGWGAITAPSRLLHLSSVGYRICSTGVAD